MTTRKHYFLPYMRQGMAALAKNASMDGERIKIPVKLEIAAINNQQDEIGRESFTKDIALLGPGDVLGINERVIVKTEPAHNSMTFEPNLIPFIEFSEPDFLWRFSTRQRQIDDKKNWLPWLCLIILKDGGEEGEFIKLKNDNPELLPRIQLNNATLPDLNESWRWAHVYLDEIEEISCELFKAKVIQSPEKATCRLLSPRRLDLETRYSAFLIPTYLAGYKTALGSKDGTVKVTDLTWDDPKIAPDIIPYYYRWDFSTTTSGDFESLVRQLEPRKLSNMGTRAIDCSNPGYGMKDDQREMIQLEGALCSTETIYQKWGMDNSEEYPNNTQRSLTDILNKWNKIANGEKLRVTPPVYGAWYVIDNGASSNLNPDENKEHWLEELNLDFRHRAAAGLGVQFVKENQESLMQAAWTQLGEIKKVNRELNLGRLGRELSLCIHKRMESMKAGNFLRLALPVQNKIMSERSDKVTIGAQLKAEDIPSNLLQVKTQRFVVRRVAAAKRTKRAFAPISKKRVVGPVFKPHVRHRKKENPETGNTVDFNGIGKNAREALHPYQTIENKLCRRIEKLGTWEQKRHGQRAPSRNRNSGSGNTAQSDPLRSVMPYPEFHRPMYRFLMELSQEYILPGLENIPPNTIGLLTTNRRFIEAFMVGLNHEFASELRWREFPTDMRGSYFRKFWDTSIYSVDEAEKDLFRGEDIGKDLLTRLRTQYPERFKFDDKELADKESWEVIEATYTNGDPEEEELQIAAAYEQAIENWLLSREEEKDIEKLELWGSEKRLGFHQTGSRDSDSLVLLVRGELLKKYSNTLIFLVKRNDAASGPAFDDHSARVFPVFEGALPPDIVLLGFPITEDQAIYFKLTNDSLTNLKTAGLPPDIIRELRKLRNHEASNADSFLELLKRWFKEEEIAEYKSLILKQARTSDYYIIFEERMTDLRFGLDVMDMTGKTTEDLKTMEIENLSWQHFSGINIGDYLNQTEPLINVIDSSDWKSAAFIAKAFFQKQVRVAIKLEELMPD